jgi:hypothetical protein
MKVVGKLRRAWANASRVVSVNDNATSATSVNHLYVTQLTLAAAAAFDRLYSSRIVVLGPGIQL